MSFFGRLSKKDSSSLASNKSEASSPQPASPRSPAPGDDDYDVGSLSDRGEPDEVDDEEVGNNTGEVQFTDEHRSLVHQRQGVLPHYIHRSWGDYTEDDLKGTKVRGNHYLKDKVKIGSGPPLYRLSHADIFYTNQNEERITCVSKHSESYISLSHQRRKQNDSTNSSPFSPSSWSTNPAAPTIIINICFPGPRSTNMNLVMYYERRVPPADILLQMKQQSSSEKKDKNEFGDDELNGVEINRVRAYDTLLQRFIAGTDAHRDGKLKIIPRVAEGGYLVKKTIGRIPAILGKKVKQSYYIDKEKNSIEIIADIGTSKVAGKIISLIKNTCKSLVVDMTFLMQGDHNDELPESILGGMRISHCDIDKIQHFTENCKSNVAELEAGTRKK